VPVESLTDEQAEAYGTFTEEPTRPELERFFFLDDDDRDLIALLRTDAHRLGVPVVIAAKATETLVRASAKGLPGANLEEPLTCISVGNFADTTGTPRNPRVPANPRAGVGLLR
jgi:hypothetical protein